MLAQEKLDKIADDDIAVTQRKDITIKHRQPDTSSTAGARLKQVVLTPRHGTHVTKQPSLPVSRVESNPLPVETGLINIDRDVPRVIDSSIRDRMRKQLENVIRKNEEILESSHVTHVPMRRGRDPTRVQEKNKVAMPLNLSVRKDLMKPGVQSESENVHGAIEKLLARHGRDLEITRKSKKEKSVIVERDTRPQINLTQKATADQSFLSKLYSQKTEPPCIPRGLKRPSPSNNNVSKKNKQEAPPQNQSIQENQALNLSSFASHEKEKIQKIVMDCRIALTPDVNGNW